MLFADTSFLCSLFREDINTHAAIDCWEHHREPLAVSDLVVLEFEQAARFQTFRFSLDRTQGYSGRETERLLTMFRQNLSKGAFTVLLADWATVMLKAQELSAAHTVKHGHRLMDILHVATALCLGTDIFLTFDGNQSLLARHSGLCVLPHLKEHAQKPKERH